MSTKLYEEAIAEAKQLRAMAEQNAKNAIIEAVTPKIKSFIEDQLLGNNSSQEDESSIMEDIASNIAGPNTDDVELSESEIDALMGLVSESSQKQALLGLISKVENTGKEKKMAKNPQDDYLEIDLDDNLLSEGAEDDVDEYSLEEIVAMLEGEGDADDADDADEADGASDADADEEKELEELAEAILRMELDLGDDVELPDEWSGDVSVEVAEEEEEEGEEDDMDAPDLDAPPDLEAPEGDEPEGDADALDDLLEDARMITISEKDLRKEIRKIKLEMDKQSTQKLKSLNEKWKKTLKLKLSQSNVSKDSIKEGRDNRVLRGQLAEYRRATKSLRKQLTEMNLFNAKLLYVNKLLQNKGVTTGQRRSIIESIDKAKSLREVQLLYKSLTGSISKSKTLSESTVRKTLGSSSRVTKGASPRRTASTEVDRWATLAGLSED